MTTKEKQNIDKNGYILIPKNFEFNGHTFEFLEQVDDNWQIYKKTRKSTGKIYYELIKPQKHEERTIMGRLYAKSFNYPSTGQFGKFGYDCISLNHCYHIYNTWVKPREAANEEEKENPQKDKKLFLPKKNFCVKDLKLIPENKSWTDSQISIKLKELVGNKKIKIVGTKPNKIGKSSKVYSLV